MKSVLLLTFSTLIIALFSCFGQVLNEQERSKIIRPDSADGMRIVTVSTADELLAAIASNTWIKLKPGVYDLAKTKFAIDTKFNVKSYSDNVTLYGCCPGIEDMPEMGFHIKHVNNLRISGDPGGQTKIHISNLYYKVFEFDNCNNIELVNLEMGYVPKHTSDFCSGGVLKFSYCNDVKIANCDLFGSGIYGLTIGACKNFKCDSTIIRECTNEIMTVIASENVSFDNCLFKDCRSLASLIFLIGSSDVSIANSVIENNIAKPGVSFDPEYADNYNLFRVKDINKLTIKNTAIRNNNVYKLMSGKVKSSNIDTSKAENNILRR